MNTLVSHQPGLGLQQLSTGHGAICWGYKGASSVASACTTCHYLGLTSALVEGTVADSVVHVASAPPNSRRAFMAPCFNSPALMPRQPSSWYRATGPWYSWQSMGTHSSCARLGSLLTRSTNCFCLDEIASGLSCAHVERGMRRMFPGQVDAN